jgi:hypothetical protein
MIGLRQTDTVALFVLCGYDHSLHGEDRFLAVLYGRMGAGAGHRFFWEGFPWSGPVEPVGYRMSCPFVLTGFT